MTSDGIEATPHPESGTEAYILYAICLKIINYEPIGQNKIIGFHIPLTRIFSINADFKNQYHY